MVIEFKPFNAGFEEWLKEFKDYFINEGFTDEIKLAKEEFTNSGIDLNEGENYEERLNIFFDWYLFDRPLSDTNLTPVRYFVETLSNKGDIYDGFSKTIHSIFVIKRRGIGYVKVKDMFTRKKYIVNGDNLIGFAKGDIVEARLLPFKGVYMFSGAFFFYPYEIKQILRREVRQFKKGDCEAAHSLLLKFRKLKTISERFTRMDIKKVYILMEEGLLA